MRHDVLIKIASLLNEHKIRWALGASYALHFYGLVDCPRDIDLIVDAGDIQKTIQVLSEFGHLEEEPPKGDYLTEYFYYMHMFGTEVDVISNFKLKHNAGIYAYRFDKEAIVDFRVLDDQKIPLTAVEDWYILYLIMDNKKQRGDLIESYFQSEGVMHPQLIDRALQQPLPEAIVKRIQHAIKRP